MKVIGITGGTGSGKSLVLEYVRQKYRACVVEADKVAHYLQKPGQVCYDSIVNFFGEDILAEDGTIDRKMLGDRVFSNRDELLQLNAVVHPAVRQEIIRIIEERRKENAWDYLFLEAALLIEEHYEAICDEMWYIYVKEDIRRERLKCSRGYSDEKITQMMASQLGEEDFRRACRIVIDNNRNEEDTFRQIREVLACQRD